MTRFNFFFQRWQSTMIKWFFSDGSTCTWNCIKAFLDFQDFDFRNFRFTTVYNSILFSFPLVLISNLHLHCFCFRGFFLCPHINSVYRGMPVIRFLRKCDFLKDLDPFVFVMLKKENQLLLGPLLMLLNSPENKLDKRKKRDHWGVLKHTAALGATKEKW